MKYGMKGYLRQNQRPTPKCPADIVGRLLPCKMKMSFLL